MKINNLILRIILLGVLDIVAIQLAILLGREIGIVLGGGILIFVLITNIVFLREDLTPWRWLMPALGGLFLLSIYPIANTLVIAFTNSGDGHLLDKQQIITQRLDEKYVSPDAPTYKVYLFRSEEQQIFNYWLVASDGKDYLYIPGEPGLKAVAPEDTTYGERDSNGIPLALGNFVRIPAGGALRYANILEGFSIDAPPNQIEITKIGLAEAQEAKELQPLWAYDEATDTLKNLQTEKEYHSERGNFVRGEGDTREVLTPGFSDFVGFDNILRVVQDSNIIDPFWRIFIWTLVFAGGSVFMTFALGLGFALVLNSPGLPLRTLFRSILVLPYAIPGWLLVVVVRGLLNPVYGPVNLAIASVFGVSPQWFSDPGLAKAAVLLVNLYLGFPYMMLISLGALQSIPGDMYEAATIDGANGRQQFRFITLPMLLVALAPLLVASFSFNFNNFTLIELLNNGGPPMSATSIAGHTDILLSYTFRLAFGTGIGVQYGFAAAISIFIFIIVGSITFFNFRLTRRLEDLTR
ncbi:MAG: ABC transporter permease subunit [Anaerolineae bacterium]